MAFMYFLAPALVLHRGRARLLIAVVGLALALGLQSLTLMVATLLALMLVARSAAVSALAGLGAAAIAAGAAGYFIERLTFTPDSDNASVLVWLQGWESAAYALAQTSGLGIGFQQLGIVTVTGTVTDKILTLLGASLNDRDGGILAAKLVAEFGVFGIAALLAYCVAFARSFMKLRSCALAGGVLPAAAVFRLSAVVMLSIELFVRGIGYFSPATFFAYVAVLAGTYRFGLEVNPPAPSESARAMEVRS
jgi:hypothetical protein